VSRANVFDPDLQPGEDDPPGFRTRGASVGREAGSRDLGASLYELPPGEALCPYHWHEANEEMLVVLSGTPRVRTPEGWRRVAPGEVVAFPRGSEGAHQVHNDGGEAARVLLVSEMNSPEVVIYPDSDKVGVRSPAPGSEPVEGELRTRFKRDSAVGYWLDERPPDPA
jgi:uncharacterized cupin superfamily protein